MKLFYFGIGFTTFALFSCQEKAAVPLPNPPQAAAPLPNPPPSVTLAPGDYAATAFLTVTVEEFAQIRIEGISAGRPSFLIHYFGRQEGFDHFLLEGKDGPVPVKLPVSRPPGIHYTSQPFSPQRAKAFIPFTC